MDHCETPQLQIYTGVYKLCIGRVYVYSQHLCILYQYTCYTPGFFTATDRAQNHVLPTDQAAKGHVFTHLQVYLSSPKEVLLPGSLQYRQWRQCFHSFSSCLRRKTFAREQTWPWSRSRCSTYRGQSTGQKFIQSPQCAIWMSQRSL